MKRIGLSLLVCAPFMLAAIPGAVLATPAPNSAFIALRTLNDCPLSTLTTTNHYPGSIWITEVMNPTCVGHANLHSWSFSENGGMTPALFENRSNFRFSADVFLDSPNGTVEAEAGLRFSPWWAPFVDGRFMLNMATGEIACSGGRLPSYSFTQNFGIRYYGGTYAHVEITYQSKGLTAAAPATIVYSVTVPLQPPPFGGTYTSPELPFDMGNLAQDPPHGLWGCLNDATVGGYFQTGAGTGAYIDCQWANIRFERFDVVPTRRSTWGRLKALYR